MDKRYITKSSFAKKCGVSSQRVNYWIHNDILGVVAFKHIEGEFIDTESEDIEYFKNFNGYKERYAKKE